MRGFSLLMALRRILNLVKQEIPSSVSVSGRTMVTHPTTLHKETLLTHETFVSSLGTTVYLCNSQL